MKREGRQHGMVRSYRIIPPALNPVATPRFTNRFDSPPAAGIFTKVSTKPTNHSKFTGKCSRSKCSDCHVHPACKSKDKAKGNQKIRSAAADTGLRFFGISVTETLDHLDAGQMDGAGDNDDDDYLDDHDERSESDGEDDKMSNMSFCEVGIEWEQIEEDWCLVAEK